jgi:hypothetical protein
MVFPLTQQIPIINIAIIIIIITTTTTTTTTTINTVVRLLREFNNTAFPHNLASEPGLISDIVRLIIPTAVRTFIFCSKSCFVNTTGQSASLYVQVSAAD